MPATFAHAVGELERICDRHRGDGGRAGYFAAMYLSVTRTVQFRAEAGRFDDAARMERFVAAFAQRYLDAHAAWSAGTAPSASWAVAFEAASRRRPIVLQHVLAGMNAHIGLDLGIVAAEIAGGPAGLAGLRGDFDAINEVLASLVDDCQGAVCRVSPVLWLADRAGRRRDELAAGAGLQVARAWAWRTAERIAGAPAAGRADVIAKLDAAVAARNRVVLDPGVHASALLLPVRLFERHGVRRGIDALAAIPPR